MQVVIIEDEALAAKRLESLLMRYDKNITVLAVLSSVKESVKWLSSNPQPDLFFMDIHLDDGQSFAIFDQIEVAGPVVFTTAYDDYTIKAFKVNSIDYLLKPINFEELEGALTKFHKLQQQVKFNPESIKEMLQAALKKEPEYKSRFLITHGAKIKTVPVEEIAYFYSEEKMTFLINQAGQRLPVDFSLDKLASVLNPKDFFRINRKFIVKMNAIDSIQKYSPTRLKLTLNPSTDQDTFVSIDKYSTFKEWLDV
ncbi:response regulator transcription factor [Adhaeribacter sp. BT258]|uniref:Response regulator transcription factor n=1 Tax=Adhaeribacter terrigena TaxID=2793070 RepID=A0ABS1C0D7_9BACT|nr:LytTR family DNA-binding domain-containing protein [Adhaeribacter terrigena]MBK0402788.1 response regulator transcription factor [Adhaeribacter terrigena]